MPGIVQVIILLCQVFPSALKAIQAWRDYHGAELNRERRLQLAADVKTMVQTAVDKKDTSGLEDAIKSLGKPPVITPSDAPNTKIPS